MRLVLSSNGICTPEIVQKTAELVGKPQEDINFAVINEGYAVEHGDHSWVLDDLNRILRNFGGRMELVNLLALDLEAVKQRIGLADAIFVVGGHADYLMSVFDKTGFSKLLPELLKDKVYIGSSAGSMVLGKRISTPAYRIIYREEGDFGTDKYLELVDFAINPHLDSPLFQKSRENILLEVAENFSGTLYGLRDDTAIIVESGKQYYIGSRPVGIIDGELSGRDDWT